MRTRSTRPRKFFSSPMGSCTGITARPKRLAQRFQRALKAGAVAVQLIDHQGARQAVLLAEAPDLFRLHFDAGDAMDQHQGGIRRHQRRLRFVHEDVVAGRVDEIDFGLAPLRIGERGADGKLALDFFFVVVGDRGAFVHLAQAVHHARRKEQSGNKLRLAGITVAYQCNIANVFAVVDFHQELLRIRGMAHRFVGRARRQTHILA